MATEEMGLAFVEWRVYLDAIATQTKLKALLKTVRRPRARLQTRLYLPSDGCRAAAAAAATAVFPPARK